MHPLSNNDPVANRDYSKIPQVNPDALVVREAQPPKPFNINPPEQTEKVAKDLKKHPKKHDRPYDRKEEDKK